MGARVFHCWLRQLKNGVPSSITCTSSRYSAAAPRGNDNANKSPPTRAHQAASQVPYGEGPLLFLFIGRNLDVCKPYEGALIALQLQWTGAPTSTRWSFDAKSPANNTRHDDADIHVIRFFKISRRSEQRRAAAAKDRRKSSAEAHVCSAGHSGGPRADEAGTDLRVS